MMKALKHVLSSGFLVAFSITAFSKPLPNCFESTRAGAEKLLAIQAVSDHPREVEPAVKRLAPVKNPMGKGKFAVEEIWGGVYKARYRMRFLYLLPLTECSLVGQEIVEML